MINEEDWGFINDYEPLIGGGSSNASNDIIGVCE
jgi:hypothetical protein